ncbi:MAG TPA: L-histidine N(alpha)-methyltransferase [Stellaceae bacterium]|nr:L-histidine N(alpha)-methyltransferase [Stellaceae bacterium]
MIHTENSYKYSIPEFRALAGRAGFRALETWTDADGKFSVHYLRRD